VSPRSIAAAVETEYQFQSFRVGFIFWGDAGARNLNCHHGQLKSFNVEGKRIQLRFVKATFLSVEGSGLLAEIDLGIYSVSALLRVAYRFTDRCYLHLQKSDREKIEVRFRSKSTVTDIEAIAGEFMNEILDQTLREIVAKESEPVRNLVLAHALSRTSLVHPELESSDPPEFQNATVPTR
jgi:His-Xaa-Ser system protein HxsD